MFLSIFFFSSRRRHTRWPRDWSSDVCSSDLLAVQHDVTARLHFVGKVAPQDVARTLADADLSVVYVRPTCLSYEDSLPNKLFEAIHAGIPVAAADQIGRASCRERGGMPLIE